MDTAPLTVFLVDDDPSVLRSNERLLRLSGYRVETFSSAAQFLWREHYDGVGCLVVDLRMPGMNGLELQQALNRAEYSLPIIFLTGHGDIPSTVKAMQAGAVDFLTKPFRAEDLLSAIERAGARHQMHLEERDRLRELDALYATLTPREQEVAVLVGQGLLNKQIAAQLGAAEKTIKIHRARVMEKLKVDSVPELVRLLDRVPKTRAAGQS